MKRKQLKTVRQLEEELKAANPADSAQLTRMLLKLNDYFMHK